MSSNEYIRWQARSQLALRLTTAGKMAASLAHEVNQPLAAMVTNAECCLRWLGKERPDLDRARKAAERIVRDGHHASNIIQSIRTVLQRVAPQRLRLDINAVIEDAIELMHDELRRHDVTVQMQLQAGVDAILGDRVQLQQVILNLVRNAVEAMSEETTRPRLLCVTTSVDAEGIALVSIADSGIGLDNATLDRIFEPFFTTKCEGMGLGLSICRSIVESHGGRLWATRREPYGSIFHFTLTAGKDCCG